MARKTAIVWAAADTVAALHAQYRAEKVTEVRMRLPALWLVRRGEGPTAGQGIVWDDARRLVLHLMWRLPLIQ